MRNGNIVKDCLQIRFLLTTQNLGSSKCSLKDEPFITGRADVYAQQCGLS